MDGQTLYMDETENALTLIWLSWQHTCRKVDHLSFASENSFVSAGSVRGFVHPVKRNFAADLLDRTHPGKSHAKPILEKEQKWPSRMVYVKLSFYMQISE